VHEQYHKQEALLIMQFTHKSKPKSQIHTLKSAIDRGHKISVYKLQKKERGYVLDAYSRGACILV
jgi:hypothetical protein